MALVICLAFPPFWPVVPFLLLEMLAPSQSN